MAHSVEPAPRRPELSASNDTGYVLIGRDDQSTGSHILAPRKRLGGAFGFSVIAHVGGVVLALLLIQMMPEPERQAFVPEIKNYDIVWLPVEGPGGGGGGGGSQSPEPPRQAELPGTDRVTVPVQPKPVPAPAPPKPEPEEAPEPAEQALTIPAQTLAAGQQTLPGVLEGLPAGATTSQGSGRGGGAGTGIGTGIGEGQGSGLGPGYGGGTGGGAYRPGAGIELPRVLREVKPQYTSDAMRAKVQGTVLLECIVQPDGSVGNVQIVRSLDPVFGLDEEAVKAARQWRFVPGKRFGEPVPVIVTIELTFTLR
jgi:periplasmic protein TonB